MTRLYGRAQKGKRCNDSSPCGRWQSTTILSSIRLDGTTECIIFDGATDRKVFDEYVKQVLAPKLRPGDIVIMDNLGAHKSQIAQEAICARKGKMLFLPAYSPDFNPIEKMWSKLKQIIRGIKPRTDKDLLNAVKKALDMVSAGDALGWFTSCGYR